VKVFGFLDNSNENLRYFEGILLGLLDISDDLKPTRIKKILDFSCKLMKSKSDFHYYTHNFTNLIIKLAKSDPKFLYELSRHTLISILIEWLLNNYNPIKTRYFSRSRGAMLDQYAAKSKHIYYLTDYRKTIGAERDSGV